MGLNKIVDVHPFAMPESGSNPEMDQIFGGADIVLDCLPGSQAPRIAGMAVKHDLHYANLTEYVKETNEIVELGKRRQARLRLTNGTCALASSTYSAINSFRIFAHKIKWNKWII